MNNECTDDVDQRAADSIARIGTEILKDNRNPEIAQVVVILIISLPFLNNADPLFISSYSLR